VENLTNYHKKNVRAKHFPNHMERQEEPITATTGLAAAIFLTGKHKWSGLHYGGLMVSTQQLYDSEVVSTL